MFRQVARAVTLAMAVVVAGAMPLLWDKEQGYLDKMMSMPIARSSIIVSRFVRGLRP